MRPSRMLAAVAVAAVTVGLALASPAGADTTPGDREAAVGTVALFGASPATPVWRTAYTTCTGQQANVRHAVTSFANLPAAGCQVVLVTDGLRFELCAGRGLIPAPFQASPIVRIEPGDSPSCRAA